MVSQLKAKVGLSSASDGGHRTQIVVAVVGALATVSTAVLASGNGGSEPGPTPPSRPALSAAAQALLEKPGKCLGGALNAPRNESVTIASPGPDAQVGTRPAVRGTTKLVNGEQLYFFTHAPGICMYYFDPWGPVEVAPDGSWTVTPNVSANVGEEMVFVAAVVEPDGQRSFGEILALDTEPLVLRLPAGTRVAHIKVRVR